MVLGLLSSVNVDLIVYICSVIKLNYFFQVLNWWACCARTVGRCVKAFPPWRSTWPSARGSRLLPPSQARLLLIFNKVHNVILVLKVRLFLKRVAHPHPFHADTDLGFHFNADPDADFHFNLHPDPSPHLRDGNLQPLVYGPSRAPVWAYRPPLRVSTPTAPDGSTLSL